MSEQIEISQRWWSAGEVADVFRVSEQTVSRWLRDGLLSGLRIGGLWRVGESDLQQFLKRVRHEANAVRAGGDSAFGNELRQAQEALEPEKVTQ